ncbi:MAG: ATP-binding protein [Paludibacteraceae bacterium]|nr:ATP-binding protein [Paludibacteraceae bacterium]
MKENQLVESQTTAGVASSKTKDRFAQSGAVTSIRKSDIAQALQEFCNRFGQNHASRLLDGVSAATISTVLNGKWESIGDGMWNNIANQLGMERVRWNAVETVNYKMLTHLLADAQGNQLWLAVTGNAGTGKTFGCKQYVRHHAEVYMVSCDPDWSKWDFFAALLSQAGKNPSGMTLLQMKTTLVMRLMRSGSPLLILDEADKLSDSVLNSFITLYNDIQDVCGVVLIATEYLGKRFDRGVRYNKKGFNELWSRVGRTCVPLKGVSQEDVVAVCRANGIDDHKVIDGILAQCEGDLRRVHRRVYAELKKREKEMSTEPTEQTEKR